MTRSLQEATIESLHSKLNRYSLWGNTMSNSTSLSTSAMVKVLVVLRGFGRSGNLPARRAASILPGVRNVFTLASTR